MSTTAAFRRTSGAWRRFFSTNNISGNPIAYLDRVYADTDSLARGVLSSDRGSLARAITLVESTRVEHQKLAAALLRALQPRLRSSTARTLRVGVSGPPGAGKSTLLEALGCEYVSRGHRVAVLAIDPSSASTGGAILGDKTRMPRLSCSPAAFVRPTPSRGTLGGVARATWDAALLCQAAGYDRVLIETVGVGQSETAVADLADAFLLVLPPAGGDELQGIKRGITEVADIVAV
ncbi:ArgK, partial [Helicosporidium sp. ATCC 50920]